MSTDAYGERMPVPRRHGPAFGHNGPPPEVAEPTEETPGPLDRRTEALVAVAVVAPVVAAYSAIGYGLYALASSFL